MKVSKDQKKYNDYLSSLFTKKELKRMKDVIESEKKHLDNMFGEVFSLAEQLRILKKHFKLSEKEFSDIIHKYRVDTPFIANFKDF